MKRRTSNNPFRVALTVTAFGSALFAGSHLYSQDEKEEEIFELSPFTVDADQDEGFRATSSLSGSRLNTDLRDIPGASSVLTREFIDAIQITDLQEASQWTTNVVADYSAVSPFGQGDGNANPVFYKVRGNATGGGTTGVDRQKRNYFPVFATNDSYMLSRMDFSRGANSVLYGNGTISGSSSSMTKRAGTSEDFKNISLSLGSWNKRRVVADLNEAFSDKFAARAVLMVQSQDGWRDREFDRRDGVFLTTTYRPTEKTEIRIEGENFNHSRLRAVPNFAEQISGWDGVTTFNVTRPSTQWNSLLEAPAAPTDPNARDYSGLTGGNLAKYYGINGLGKKIIFDPNGPGMLYNYQNTAVTAGGGNNQFIPVSGFRSGEFHNSTGGFRNISYQVAGNPLTETLGLRDDVFDTAVNAMNAAGLDGSSILTKEFNNSPDAPSLKQEFHDVQATITHNVGDLFFELAVDVNEANLYGHHESTFGGRNLYIDINEVLPDGSPNPGFLQPYTENDHQVNHFTFKEESWRGAAAYVMDDNEWGSLVINANVGQSRGTKITDYRRMSLRTSDDHRLWGYGSDRVYVRRYLLNDGPRPRIDTIFDGNTSIDYYDPVSDTTTTVTPAMTVVTDRRDIQRIIEQDSDYAVLSGQASLFKDKLILLGAGRWDDFQQRDTQQINKGDYSSDWDGVTAIYRPVAPDDWFDLSYVPKDSDGNPISESRAAISRPRDGQGVPLAQYAGDRFRDDYDAPHQEDLVFTTSLGFVWHALPWMSPTFNFAETYNPSNASVTIYNDILPQTSSEGFDTGVRFELFDHKLHMNLTYYEGELTDQWRNHRLDDDFNKIINANVIDDHDEFGLNQMQFVPFGIFRDTQDSVSQGVELDFTYNPTAAIRVRGNYAIPKNGWLNRYPDLHKYWGENKEKYRQMVAAAGVLFDEEDFAETDPDLVAAERLYNGGSDANAAAAGWNTIRNFLNNNIEGDSDMGEGQRSGNIYADYTFQDGGLKGLRAGLGLQWRGKRELGDYRGATIADPNDPLASIDDPNLDENDKLYLKSHSTFTASLAYNWTLKDGKKINARLAVKNLFDDDTVLYSGGARRDRAVNGDFSSPARQVVPTRFNYKAPRSYELTVTLKM